jgi:ankyrin repeat/BTB/POZ domain-containing protein 1
VYDVLVAADIYLLPGLQRQCGVFLAKCIDVYSVLDILRTARLFNLGRLEDACYQCIADNFETVVCE